MSKLIIQVPESVLSCPEHLRDICNEAESFISSDDATCLILPSDEGWAISVDGEGKMSSVEIKVEENY